MRQHPQRFLAVPAALLWIVVFIGSVGFCGYDGDIVGVWPVARLVIQLGLTAWLATQMNRRWPQASPAGWFRAVAVWLVFIVVVFLIGLSLFDTSTCAR